MITTLKRLFKRFSWKDFFITYASFLFFDLVFNLVDPIYRKYSLAEAASWLHLIFHSACIAFVIVFTFPVRKLK